MATSIIKQLSDMRKPDKIKEICSRNTPVSLEGVHVWEKIAFERSFSLRG